MEVNLQSVCNQQTAQTAEQGASIKESFLSKKCPFHQNQRCDLVHLNNSTTKHQICMKCAQRDKIQLSEVLFINDLINADQISFFPGFPVLTDSDLISEVETASKQVEEILKKTDEYFYELKQQLNSTLEVARSRSKTFLAKLSDLYFDMIASYQEAFKLEEFKKILINNNTRNDDQILHDYILNLYDQSSVNTQRISNPLKSFQNLAKTYDLHALKTAQQQLLEIIQNLNIIEQNNNEERSIIPFNVLPSFNFEDSSKNLKIIKDSTGSISITSLSQTSKQCYIDMELQIKEKYIIRLEIIHNNMSDSKNPGFGVGLIKSSLKQNKDIIYQKICYGECSEGFGIDKIVKGSQLFSKPNSKEQRFLEFRIHLGSKYIRAANLPDYSSVVELDDTSKIKEGEKYYFGMIIYWETDQIKINEVLKVPYFDNKMNK